MVASTPFNLIGFTTATVGLGGIVVGAAIQNCQTPAQFGIADGTVVSYVIFDGVNVEYGHGTTSTSGAILQRTTPFTSSISLSGFAVVSFQILAEDIGTIASQNANNVTLTGLFGTVPREVTTNVSFSALSTDQIIGLNPSVPASFTITLPLSSTRSGIPVEIVDLQGFMQSFPISVVMTGGDTCLGVSSGAPLSGILNQNYQSLTFKPRASGGYFL